MNVEGGRHVKMWTNGVPVEDQARAQLANTARMPFIFKHVAAMPDVHVGIGATVGSDPGDEGRDHPGCGRRGYRLRDDGGARRRLKASDLPESLATIRTEIERAVPHGVVSVRGQRDKGAWSMPPAQVLARWSRLADRPQSASRRSIRT